MATKTKKTTDLQKEIKKTADDAYTSAKTTVETVQRDLADAAGDVKDAAQKVFLAGLGALVVAEEEGSKAFKKLVKKGSKVELPGLGMERIQAVRRQIGAGVDDATDAVSGRVTDARYAAGKVADETEDRLQDTVSSVMKRLGVPTRQEISDLTASVEKLATHVERLKTERAAQDELTMEAVGGGWYEIKIGDVVVEKVQGKEDAEQTLIRVQEHRA